MNIGRKRRSIGTVISLASMADIAFLLLIFFVVTSAIERQSAEGIRLPTAESENRIKKDLSFALTVTAAGRILHEGKQITPAALRRLILTRKNSGLPVGRVQISGDRSCPYGKLAPYMEVLKKTGVKQVVFLASYKKEPQ